MPNRHYGDRLDYLTALITYLALTRWKSRTAPNLASGLSLDPAKVQQTFDDFPGIFRRSPGTNKAGNYFYTLHARFALRPYESDDEDPDLPEVRPEILTALLQFVTQNASVEEETRRHEEVLQSTREIAERAKRSADRATAAAVAAAVIALIGTIITVFFSA